MKKLKMAIKSNNVLFYMIFFMAIVLLVITIMGGYMYFYCYKVIYTDFLNENRRRLETVTERHESDLQIIDDIVTQLSMSDDITKFKLENQAQKGIKLINRLKQYTLISQFFSSLFYQYHDDHYIFNGDTSVTTEYFVEKGCTLEKTDAEELRELLMADHKELYVLPEQKGNGAWFSSLVQDVNLTFFFRTIPPSNKETVVFVIPGSYYDRLLYSQMTEQSCTFLYYNDQVIVLRGDLKISKEELNIFFYEEDAIKNITGDLFFQKEVKVKEGAYLLSAQRGKSQIYYGTLQSMDVFQEKMMMEQWSIILLIFGGVVVALSVIALFSKKIVGQVKKINLLLDEEDNFDLTSVQEGIQALIVNREEMQRENLTHKRIIFIRNFIRGDYNSREAVVAAADEARLNVDYQKYVILVLRNREVNKENKVFTSILEMLANEKYVGGYGIRLISNNQNVFVLFGNTEDQIEGVLEKLLEIEKRFCQDYIIALSSFHSDFGESSKGYLEADVAFDNHLLLDNNRIIRFSEISRKEYDSFSAESYLKQLQYAIQSVDMKAVEAAVSGICSKFKHENASLYAFRIFYLDIIHVLLKEWEDEEGYFDRFYNVFTLSQCMNVQEFYDLLCEICKVIIGKKSSKDIQEHDIVREAITYMQENYHDPNLTMNELADRLQINPVMLSMEFRNEMDIRPSDYLGNLRMEKAKKLLSTTNMLIREISISVGYEDEHVFRRRFKKYTGMTAKQWREEKVSTSKDNGVL